MSQNFNLNQQKLNMLLNMASKHTGQNPNSLKNDVESGNIQNVLSQLPPDVVKKFNNIISNQNEIDKLMSSPQAQQLLKTLKKGNQ